MRTRQQGFSLIELLIAATLLIVVLGIVATYFARQAKYTRDTQGRTQVQDMIRATMQVVTNDLMSAGATQYVDSATSTTTKTSTTPSSTIVVTTAGGTYEVTVEYVTSLRSLGSACRQVTYLHTADGRLGRYDDACGATLPSAPVDSAHLLANQVLAFDVGFVCSDNPATVVADPATCTSSGAAYVRNAVVGVMARSEGQARSSATATYSSPISGGGSVTCPQDYVCASLIQEVQTPNLKDN